MGHATLLNRRALLQGTGLAAFAGVASGAAPSLFGMGGALSKSAAPFAQAPGFFRFNFGKLGVTIISDGSLELPTSVIGTNKPEAEVKAYLKSNFIETEQFDTHENICLIDTGDKLVMIDTGSGANFQKSAGKVTANLAYAGIKPEDIDVIIITHGHPDHIWGIMDDATGKPRFPNAEYIVNAAEWDYWTDEDLPSKLPKQYASLALGARRNLIPVSAKTRRVKPGDEVLPGIHLIDTPGHTVGHVSVQIDSEGESMIVTGDVLFDPYVSLERLDWHYLYDADKELAVKTRKSLLDMLAKDKILTVAYHFPFPGVGHVAARGQNYRWVPISWSWQL